MSPSDVPYELPATRKRSVVREEQLETTFIEKLRSLKYTVRADIRDRAALERNFRAKFEELNRVHFTDCAFRSKRPPVPIQFGHPVRFNSASDSEPIRPSLSGVMALV